MASKSPSASLALCSGDVSLFTSKNLREQSTMMITKIRSHPEPVGTSNVIFNALVSRLNSVVKLV